MSENILDYLPLTGTYREYANGGGFMGGGQETADDMRNSSIFDYSWACSVCENPISETDTSCAACGEPIEWNKPPVY